MRIVIVCEARVRRGKQMVLTPQREIILQELRHATDHPTADELFKRVRCRLPRISLATVYRNLESMSRAGLVRKIQAAGSQKRFDGNMFPHDHMRCVSCGVVLDSPTPLKPDPLDLPREIQGHRVVGYSMEILVVCASCQDSGAAQTDS